MARLENTGDLAAQLAPPRIADDAGTPLSVHHLNFVGLDARSIADWRARRAPLGMHPAEYREFCSTFFTAALKDGFKDTDIDVRIKGSSAVIYSGLHKQLPTEASQWHVEFKKLNSVRRSPTAAEQKAISDSFDRLYFHQPLPHRRPFDCMFELKIDAKKSDYDIQLSSGPIENACFASTFRVADIDGIHDDNYGFILPDIADHLLTAVVSWADKWTRTLGRSVSVKVFGKSGPPNKTLTIRELSSHFRDQDWIMSVPDVRD